MRTILTAFCALALFSPLPAASQPRASERGLVSQRVNGVQITVDYSRPVARGRDNLFGGVVHAGEVWTPGANWATTIEADRDLTLNGHELPAGKYSIWIVTQPGEWQFRLHDETELYHDSPVPEDGFFLEFPVVPEKGAHMESLAWYFPVVEAGAATLRMHWGDTFVPLQIETAPYQAENVPAAERAMYVGSYAIDGNDPTTFGPLQFVLQVLEENGRLVGRWGRAPVALIPVGEAEFLIGFTRSGALFDVADEMTVRLLVEGDRASAAELLWMGEPTARGERVPR